MYIVYVIIMFYKLLPLYGHSTTRFLFMTQTPQPSVNKNNTLIRWKKK